jgi:hypothetical protein
MIDYRKITFNSTIAGVLAGLVNYQIGRDPARAVEVGLFVALGHSTGLWQATPMKRKKPKSSDKIT